MSDETNTLIGYEQYRAYLDHLLNADLQYCRREVQGLLDGGVPLASMYVDLLQRALYDVGDLWASNRISVAVEHMAAAMTEDLMRMASPLVREAPRIGRKAIVSCTVEEYHQVGARMVADLLELQGWDVIFLGANAPVDDVMLLTDQLKPDLLALSVTMPSNLRRLAEAIRLVRQQFDGLPIAVGGQAFALAGAAQPSLMPGVWRVETVDHLGQVIAAS